MSAPNSNFSPGSHPHADRPNWQPAETADEYFRNCQEGLETFSERRAAKIMGVSRIKLWRWRRTAEIPDDLFERLMTELDHIPSSRELANIGQAVCGKNTSPEAECCPHCGGLLRLRGRWRESTRRLVRDWIKAKRSTL